MSHAGLVWANLRRRPVQGLLVLTCVGLVFAIYGLLFGMLAGFRQSSIPNATFEQQLLTGAIAVSAVGVGLILLLTAAAMAHAVRLRMTEFGLLKALGFSHRRIIALVIAETTVPCLTGAALGLLAAPLLFAMLSSWVPQLATLQLVYGPAMLCAALAVALLLPALSSVVPALRIVRLDAASALTGRAEAAPVRSATTRKHRPAVVATAPAAGVRAFTGLCADQGLLRQILIVARISFGTLRQRVRSALLVTGGVGCTMFMLLWLLSTAQGVRTRVLESGEPSRVILRAASTTWLPYSKLPESIVATAAHAPGVARALDGSALAEPVLYGVIGSFPRREGGRPTVLYIIGVARHWPEMTTSFQLLSGRLPTPGTNEVMVGQRAPRALIGLDGGPVKRHLEVNGRRTRDVEWQVVGTFSTGDLWDGYVVGDINVLRQYGGDLFATSMLVKLTSPESFDAFRGAVERQLPPSLRVERETDFYAGFWTSLPKLALYVAALLGALMALGITAAMVQITHAALEARRREIATLRVLGFDGRSVAVSVTLEAMLFAVLGAALASGLVWLLRDGDLWAGAWSVFEYQLDLQLLLFATGSAALAAVIGTLPMALRTLRRREMEVLQDLREVEQAVTPARPGGRDTWDLPASARPLPS